MTEELPLMLERCDVPFPDNLDSSRSIVVIPETHDGILSEKHGSIAATSERSSAHDCWTSERRRRRAKDTRNTVSSTSYRTACVERWYGNTGASTEIHPRETAWLLDEMSDIENDETRYLSVRSEARRLWRETEAVLSE